RHEGDGLRHGNVVMLVSLLVAPYCWLYDQPLALPAVMFALWQSSSRKVIAALGAIYIVLESQGFWATAGLRSRWYLWPALAWFVWYLVAMAKPKHVEAASLPPETVVVGYT